VQNGCKNHTKPRKLKRLRRIIKNEKPESKGFVETENI